MAYITFQPSDYFNTVLWTTDGTGSKALTTGHSTDMVWIKFRDYAYDNRIYDNVRGVTKKIIPNKTDAESTTSDLDSFDTNGFTVSNNFNTSGEGGLVGWSWKAGTTGSGTTTGAGTGKSYTYSVDTTSGFSIVAYTGNGTDGHTIPHHLGAVPKMVIYKRRSGASNWIVYHESIGATKEISLDLSSAASTSTVFNDTAPTSTVNELKNNSNVNANDATFVMYSFAEKKGFSKFGSYTGNGNADGPFIYTGFKPAFVLYKNSSDAATNWQIHDSARSPSNLSVNRLNPNDSSVELSTTGDSFDLLSNGFKARGTASNSNTNTKTYIFMAFAEHPIVSSNDIPGVAR